MLKLVIREPGEEPREFQLDEGTYIMGRDEESDILFSDEAVSRSHAQISFEDGQVEVEDFGSTAGIYVNRNKVQEKCPLNPGDEILIGSTKIKIEGDWPEEEQQEASDSDEEDKTRMVSPDQLQRYLDGQDKTQIIEDRTQIIEDKTEIISDQADMPVQSEDEKTRMLGADEVLMPESDSTPAPDKTVFLGPDDDQIVTNYHKLFIISKDDFGKEYVLDQPEMSIGRSKDCEIVIEDETVSGTHSTIRTDGDRSFISDANSKNGTIVNGSPVSGESELKKGDEIEIGDAKFKFVHKDAAISKEELLSEIKQSQNKKTKNKILIAALAGFCILLLLIVISRDSKEPVKKAAVQTTQPKKDTMEPLVPQKTPEVEKKPDIQEVLAETKADVYFHAGSEFLKNRLWDEAIEKFEDVRKINPDYPAIQDGIFTAKTEALNRSFLEEGLILISQGRYKEGLKQLEGISTESVYIDEATLEIQFARDELKPPKPKKTVAAVKEQPKKPKTDTFKQKGNELIKQALKYYTKGNTKIAVTKLNSALELNLPKDDSIKTRASDLKEKIEQIQEAYDKGLSEYNNQQVGQAFQTWSDVITLDQELVGKEKSHFSGRIAIYMADEFYRQGREAYESGRFVEAYSNCRKALTASPGHKGCLEIEGLLAEKAKKMYEEGYILEDLNPTQAIQKWKMVLGICSPENPHYKKAKSRIAKYEMR